MEELKLTPGRRDDISVRNDRIAESARRNRFDDVTPIPLLCECDDARCGEFVRVDLAGLKAARERGEPVTAPGHGSRLGAAPG